MKKIIVISLALLIMACNPTGNEDSNGDVSVEPVGDSRELVDTSTMEIDRVIEIKARRFEFEPSEIRLKKGEKVRFKVINEDFEHGMILGGTKMTENDVFVADTVGTIEFSCANICGDGHSGMNGKIIIEE